MRAARTCQIRKLDTSLQRALHVRVTLRTVKPDGVRVRVDGRNTCTRPKMPAAPKKTAPNQATVCEAFGSCVNHRAMVTKAAPPTAIRPAFQRDSCITIGGLSRLGRSIS